VIPFWEDEAQTKRRSRYAAYSPLLQINVGWKVARKRDSMRIHSIASGTRFSQASDCPDLSTKSMVPEFLGESAALAVVLSLLTSPPMRLTIKKP
jgi:hypothetical protein